MTETQKEQIYELSLKGSYIVDNCLKIIKLKYKIKYRSETVRDNVVNNQSQLGIKFSDNGKKADDRIFSVRSVIVLDRDEGHRVYKNFHGEILYRTLTSNKVIEYLKM